MLRGRRGDPGRSEVPVAHRLGAGEAVPMTVTRLLRLPLCSLHVMEAGSGEPLIMVPAMLSELRNWKATVQFISQWFHTYFFELPGHGLSTPLPERFTTTRVAEVVGQLADQIEADQFNLMGFSFGGILAMKTYHRFESRVERLILLAPCITHEALRLSRVQKLGIVLLNRLLKNSSFRGKLLAWMHRERNSLAMARLIAFLGGTENPCQLAERLRTLAPVTAEIVCHEIDDILGAEFAHPKERHSTRCLFAMSIHDPLLDYETTLNELRSHFDNVLVTPLDYPFHQRSQPFTFNELNQCFGETVDRFFWGP